MDEVMTICFAPTSMAGKTVLTTPPTFVANVRCAFVSVSSPVETPAFAKTRSSGASAWHLRIHSRTAASFVTSIIIVDTASEGDAAFLPRESRICPHLFATASSRSWLRPHRNSLSPLSAHAMASASPTPELAPVIKVFMSQLYQNTVAAWKKAVPIWSGFFDIIHKTVG